MAGLITVLESEPVALLSQLSFLPRDQTQRTQNSVCCWTQSERVFLLMTGVWQEPDERHTPSRVSLRFGPVLGISSEILWRCWRMADLMRASLSFSKAKTTRGAILGAESRAQKTNPLFANHRAHAWPDCRMSLSASAEPPLCVMSSKAIFGCSPSIFDRKPRSKVEIPLLRDCKNDWILHFPSSHSDRRTND